MKKSFVSPFSFLNLKNENEKTNRFSFILLNFLNVKCNCGIVHAQFDIASDHKRTIKLEF